MGWNWWYWPEGLRNNWSSNLISKNWLTSQGVYRDVVLGDLRISNVPCNICEKTLFFAQNINKNQCELVYQIYKAMNEKPLKGD